MVLGWMHCPKHHSQKQGINTHFEFQKWGCVQLQHPQEMFVAEHESGSWDLPGDKSFTYRCHRGNQKLLLRAAGSWWSTDRAIFGQRGQFGLNNH